MTVSLKHKFTSAKSDSADASLIRPSNWNDEHDLTLATDRLLGRDTTGTGVAEEITVAGGLEFTGTGGIQRSALTGDVTASAGSNATTIANDAVTYAKIQNVSTNNTLLGRSTAGAGDIEEIIVSTGLTLSGGALSVTASTYQPLDGDLTAIAALSNADNNFIVGNGSTWVAESGATARTSMGLGTGDTPQFTGIEVGNASDTTISRSSAGVIAVEGGVVPKENRANTFTANQIIEVTDNTNAAVRVTQLGTGNALVVEDSTNPDSTPFVISNSGQLITGHTSAITIDGTTPYVQFHGPNTSLASGVSDSAWLNSAGGPFFTMSKSRSITIGSNSIVSSGDSLGEVRFYGDDGTGFVQAAKIQVIVDGTPGVGDMPGRLVFYTSADGASSPTERMRITSAVSENILFGTTASQGAGRVQSLGDSATSAFLAYASSTGQRETFRFVNGNGLIGSLGMTGTSLNITTGGSVRLTVDSSGDVGIGTASPACSLDVTGGIQTSRTAVTSPAATDGNIFSGTYTPTLTNTTNVAASTAYQCQYMRVGNVVTLSGAIDVDATAASTLTVVGVSLPIASNFSASQNAGGAGGADGVNSVPCIIYGDATNDRLTLTFTPIDGANRTYRFIATYRVI